MYATNQLKNKLIQKRSAFCDHIQCDDAKQFFVDVHYRLTHSYEVFERVVDDNVGNVYCQMRIDCVFLQKLQKMTKKMVDEMLPIEPSNKNQGLEKYVPVQGVEPKIKDLFYLVVREFGDQLIYIIDGLEFITTECFLTTDFFSTFSYAKNVCSIHSLIALDAHMKPNVKPDLDDLVQKAKDFQTEFAMKVNPVVSIGRYDDHYTWHNYPT